MPTVHAGGIDLYYEIHGKGAPLVLIGGFADNSLVWSEFLPFLTPYYQVIFFDNRGSGRSDTPPLPYSIKAMAKDTAALLDALSIKEAYFMGHSMGGMILQELCLDSPKYVKKAVICSSCAKVPIISLMQIDTVADLFQTGIDPALIFRTVLPWLFSNELLSKKAVRDKVLERFIQNPYPQKPLGYFNQGEALKHFDSRDKLSSISTPCLIAVGEEDLYTPLACSKWMKEKIPRSELVVLSGQGHMINVERPKELSETIRAFCP
jgi:3-oxoadipate enol-lactonase